MEFRGVFASLTTPFDHLGEIYWSKVHHNLARLGRTTLSGYVVGDRWGEGLLLSSTELAWLWKEVVSQAGAERSVSQLSATAEWPNAVRCLPRRLRRMRRSAAAGAGRFPHLSFRGSRRPVFSINSGLGIIAGPHRRCAQQRRRLAVGEIIELATHPKLGAALVSSDDATAVNELIQEVGEDFQVMVPALSDGAVPFGRRMRGGHGDGGGCALLLSFDRRSDSNARA